MALAETAKLFVNLSLTGNFAKQMATANKSLSKFESSSNRAYRAGQQIGTGIKNAGKIAAIGVGLLASQVALGLNSLVKLEQQTAQTNAVIKSTGGVAGVTADEVGRLAEKYEGLNATIGDETIRAGENLLLTFTNIREKAFEPALATALDMNTALGKGEEGLTSTVRLLGKALNDPTKGLSALSRVGVTFSKEQTERIKQLQKEGKLYEAQGLILTELNKRYEGSFLAKGNTTAGKVAKFTDSIEDLQRALATTLLPTVGIVADELTKFLQDPAVMRGASQLGKDIAGIFSKQNIAEGAQILRGFFELAKDVAPAIATAAKVTGQVIGTAVKMFQSLPAPLQTLLVSGLAINKLTGGLVTNLAGGLISSVLKQLVAGVVNVRGATVIVSGGVPGAAGGAGAAAGAGAGGGLKGAAGNALKLVGVVGAAALADEFSDELEGFGRDLRNQLVGKNFPSLGPSQLQWPFGPKNTPTILPELGGNGILGGTGAAPKTGGTIKTFETNKNALGGRSSQDNDPDKRGWRNANKETLAELRKQRAENRQKLADLSLQVQRKGEQTVSSVDKNKAATKSAVDQAKTRLAAAEAKTARDVYVGASRNVSATTSGASRVVSAIYANRPVTNVSVNVSNTSITRVSVTEARYGKSTGSGGQNQVRPA
jgi:hypothetical protein